MVHYLTAVTCHPTQVNAPRLNPSHAGWYSIYLPQRDGRLSWPRWLDSARMGDEPATFRSRVRRRTAAPPRQNTAGEHRRVKATVRLAVA